jgi:hypothetical protein
LRWEKVIVIERYVVIKIHGMIVSQDDGNRKRGED